MSLLYGVFTTDGEYEKGNFQAIDKEFPELVKKLADSDVALHLKITETQIIIGSAINLKIQGGRNDSRVFVLRYCNGGNIRSLDLPDVLKRFFPSAIEYLQGANYQILDVWGEEQLSEKIKNLGDNPLPPVGEVSRVVAGKLLTGKPVYVEAKDLFKAICLISEVAAMVKPFDYLEYTFVISRLSFVDADLLVGPNKPLNTEFDLNLDTGRILAAAGLEEKYKQIVKNSKNELIIRNIRNKEFTTKQDLAAAITQESWKGLPGIEKMEWEKIAAPLGLQFSLTARETIEAVLKTGNAMYWNRYASSPGLNIQEIRAAILKIPWNDFERFVQLIRPSLLAARDPFRTAIYDILVEKTTILHARADQAAGLLAGLKPDIRPAPGGGKYPPEDQPLTTRGPRKTFLAIGILVLIIAVAFVVIMSVLGGRAPAEAPSERTLSEHGGTLAILNLTIGKGNITLFDKYNSTALPQDFPRNYTYDSKEYSLNSSKIIQIEPENAPIEGTLKIYTPELTTSTGFIGHYNASSKAWEEIIPIINQPDFTLPITSGGIYGIFS
jgi:hypothetical protein